MQVWAKKLKESLMRKINQKDEERSNKLEFITDINVPWYESIY